MKLQCARASVLYLVEFLCAFAGPTYIVWLKLKLQLSTKHVYVFADWGLVNRLTRLRQKPEHWSMLKVLIPSNPNPKTDSTQFSEWIGLIEYPETRWHTFRPPDSCTSHSIPTNRGAVVICCQTTKEAIVVPLDNT